MKFTFTYINYFFISFVFVSLLSAQTNVTFLSNLNPYPSAGYANIWGYVAPNGTEYALLGCGNGTSIISLADPINPVQCAFIPAPQSSWRELKVYSHYAYVATDATGNGLQIIDLSPLPDTAILVNTLSTYFTNAHDLLIDNGYCYVVGGSGSGGMRILDLSNPVIPVLTAYYTASGYIHDIYIWNDTVVASCGYTQQYHLIDVTNKFSPQFISASPTLPGIYAHSGWMTEDKRYFFATEEFNVRDLTVWDLQDRSTWDLVVPSWGLANSSKIHNLYILGNYAHVSYYTSGYLVLDISDPINPQIAGQYDTYPADNSSIYDGAWGVYPYLPSGITIVSDISTGLYVLRFNPPVQTFQLSVSIAAGWNMVSIPGNHPNGNTVDNWWPYRDLSANVFKYNNGYQQADTLTSGTGYWMKHTSARLYNTGDEWPASGIIKVPNNPIPIYTGWNLIGPYECPVNVSNLSTTPPGLQSGQVFGYFNGYVVAGTLDPGYGYWFKSTADGFLNLPQCGSFNKKSDNKFFISDDWGKIIFKDNADRTFTLYCLDNFADKNNFELPPVPPEGIFDIRFSNGSFGESLNSDLKIIEMRGITFPLNIRAENIYLRLQDESGLKLNEIIRSGEEIIITETMDKLFVSGETIPMSYSLRQNYPNPFNPSTTIEFSLPEDVNNVSLSIYNMVGEKVTEIVNNSLTAGVYKYQWNAENAASGIYIYKLKTEKFVSSGKMVLIK